MRVMDLQQREGVAHMRVPGKRGKVRLVPVTPVAQRLPDNHLAAAGHRGKRESLLFQNSSGTNGTSALNPASVCCAEVVREPPVDCEHFSLLDWYELSRMSMFETSHKRDGGFEALSFDEEADFGGVSFHDVGGTDTQLHYRSSRTSRQMKERAWHDPTVIGPQALLSGVPAVLASSRR